MIGETRDDVVATLLEDVAHARARAGSGSIEMSGLDGAMHDARRRREVLRAPRCVARRLVGTHDVESPYTATSWWCRTKYSWKLSRPSSVSKHVATGSSVTGNSRTRTPSRSHSSRVTCVFVAPSLSRWER